MAKQPGRVVRVRDLKAEDPEVKSRSDHWLDLFQVALVELPSWDS